MSFGSGGFGGFGQSNTQSAGFGSGGFGTNTNTGGFGQNAGAGFGGTAGNTGTGLFGGGSAGGFGSNTATSGFGQTATTSAFGAKPAFGATTGGGGLFGGGTATTTAGPSGFGGGFGAAGNTAATTSFGSTGNSLFGANKPPTFGTTTGNTTTGTQLFGGGGATAGFGMGTGATGAFGATNNPGIGTNVGDPPGTQAVAFQPTTEKELNNPSQSNAFQNILFMEPYKKFSADELRLADYNQGRRHGNAQGAGAFGVGSFGGGFGGTTASQPSAFGTATTSGGLFGANTTNQATTGGFGQPAATGGFGAATGGLFGQNKPAGGGLFGGATTTQAQQPAQGGGLFGSGGFGNTGTTTGGFGQNTGTSSLFGANANAAKPASGFSFGNTGTTGGFGNTGTSGFGANTGTTNTGGGLFGGGATAQPAAGGGLFGQTQGAATTAFGTGAFGQQQQQAGTGLFGANAQQKPATGLFGASTTAPAQGGGLFGGGAQTSGFGAAQPTQTAGGLFGAKPAATTGGLFGTAPAQTGTAGGLFGGGAIAQQQQPAQGGGLFGSTLGSNQPKPLFGATAPAAGGGLFGGTAQPQQGGGLFGSTQQPQAQSILGGSAFGASQSQIAPQPMRTSLNDLSAFGATSLFAGMSTNEVQNPGPLATPLSSAKKQPPRAAILPIYKLSKPSTPKRGFGFSYSTYGSPATPSSVASTPGGFGQSLLAGSISRGLSKSISTSNLRRSFNVDDTILAPGAFSASAGPRNLSGPSSVKKLVINRDIRSDLFSTPTKKDKQPQDSAGSARKASKRVSFDPSTAAAIEQGTEETAETPNANGNGNVAPRDLGYLRPSTRASNGVNGASATPGSSADAAPEMEQVKGKELAIVHEEESPAPSLRSSDAQRDLDAGDYWMSPSKEELQNMNRVQRQKVTSFTVGRDNIGHVRFRVPVDLSNIDLDEIYEGLVQLRPRSCTVYPNPAKKPAMGKGLNVPSEITLEQSWPRGRDKSGARYNKHIERLKRIPDTKFVSYNPETGVWVFTVEHFTTYGLDDDEDDDEDYDQSIGQDNAASGFRARSQPEATQPRRQPQAVASPETDPDDTFDFQRHARWTVPGAFDPDKDAIGEEDETDHRALVRPPSPDGASDSASSPYLATDTLKDQADLEMTVEHDVDSPEISMAVDVQTGPGALPPLPTSSEAPAAGIMRARMRAIKESVAPGRIEVTGGDDWMDILKKSVNSGQQRDRAALRTLGESTMNHQKAKSGGQVGVGKRVVSDGRGFATSIDLMNSLFGKDKTSSAVEDGASVGPPAKSLIKWPYQRQHQDRAEEASSDPRDRPFRVSFKPRWGPGDNTLLVSKTPGPKHLAQIPSQTSTGIATSTNEIWSVRLLAADKAPGQDRQTPQGLRHGSWITTKPVPGKVPEITRPARIPSLKEISNDVAGSSPSSTYERLVWTLASILFDPVDEPSQRRRRADLSAFWQTLVEEQTRRAVSDAHINEEKAFASLAGHRIVDACKHLLDARLYKLATLVPLIGTSDQARNDMAEQLEDWYDGDVLSEIETPIRAVYSLLAGRVSLCKGKTAAGSENRLDAIALARHFGLDWKQAFGLRLWYGISATDDIAAAVKMFEEDMDRGLVPQPVPWHADSDEDKENSSEGIHDMLWGLLRLYAGRASLEEVLQPESCSPSHSDYSLCWQLGQVLSASGRASFASRRVEPRAPDALIVAYQAARAADLLTVAYGSQLMGSGLFSDAVAVLLHISDRAARTKAVQEAVARVALEHASSPKTNTTTTNGGGSSSSSTTGVRQLLELEARHHVPKTWIAEACALAYRYLGARADCTHPANFHLAMREVRCLALADRPQELQAVVVRRLDPLAVLQWPLSSSWGLFLEYLRARPVDDGLGDLAALAATSSSATTAASAAKRQGGGSGRGGGGSLAASAAAAAQQQFDFDGYAAMLRRRYEDAARDDVVTLAALSSLMEFVQDRKRLAVAVAAY